MRSFVAVGIQNTMRMRPIILLSMSYPAVQSFPTLRHKRQDLKKLLFYTKCVFRIFYNFCLKYFSFYEELSEIWSKIYVGSWIKRDQLDVTCFIFSLFNAQHVSDVNTSILRSLRLFYWVISWVVLLWFDACLCYGVVWLGWCGIRMQAEAVLQPASGYHTTPPQWNHNVTPTRIQPEQYNPWNNSTNKSQAPEVGCINIRNMLSIK